MSQLRAIYCRRIFWITAWIGVTVNAGCLPPGLSKPGAEPLNPDQRAIREWLDENEVEVEIVRWEFRDGLWHVKYQSETPFGGRIVQADVFEVIDGEVELTTDWPLTRAAKEEELKQSQPLMPEFDFGDEFPVLPEQHDNQ